MADLLVTSLIADGGLEAALEASLLGTAHLLSRVGSFSQRYSGDPSTFSRPLQETIFRIFSGIFRDYLRIFWDFFQIFQDFFRIIFRFLSFFGIFQDFSGSFICDVDKHLV